jgi:hypothetical protein
MDTQKDIKMRVACDIAEGLVTTGHCGIDKA